MLDRSLRGPLQVVAIALCAMSAAMASASPASDALSFGEVFVQALVHGRASQPMPANAVLAQRVAQMQSQSGDSGPIVVQAMRVVRFVQQSRCGRVVFGFSQRLSHKGWLGGQLNICEDGLPPLRVCADRPTVLVPSASRCRDNSSPVDTAEVAAAIASALANGDLSPEQAREKQAAISKAGAPAPASGAKRVVQ